MDALASAVSSVSQDIEMQKKMGVAGRAKVTAEYRAFDEAKWLSDLIESYQRSESSPALAVRPNEVMV